jgi:hypothetical protein
MTMTTQSRDTNALRSGTAKSLGIDLKEPLKGHSTERGEFNSWTHGCQVKFNKLIHRFYSKELNDSKTIFFWSFGGSVIKAL